MPVTLITSYFKLLANHCEGFELEVGISVLLSERE